MSSQDGTDLAFVSDNELLVELFSRFDHCEFSGLKSLKADRNKTRRKWKGNPHTCAGLAIDIAQMVILSRHADAVREKADYDEEPRSGSSDDGSGNSSSSNGGSGDDNEKPATDTDNDEDKEK